MIRRIPEAREGRSPAITSRLVTCVNSPEADQANCGQLPRSGPSARIRSTPYHERCSLTQSSGAARHIALSAANRLSWALASGAPAIKEARTTRVAGPHAEFQTSGARKQCCAGEICGLQGPPMELSSARMSIPLRPATVNALSWRYANGCPPYSWRAPRSVRRRTDGSSCKA
jgi:hypothetical protein